VSRLRTAAAAALALGAIPLWTPDAAAADCHALPAGFALCPAGAPWAEVRRVEFGHGVAFEAGDWWLEAIDLPDGFQEADSLDAALDALIAASNEEAQAEGLPASEVVARERFATDTLEVASVTMLADLGAEDGVIPIASLIAEAGGHRIALMLDYMEDIAADALHDALRDIVGMVRPAPEG